MLARDLLRQIRRLQFRARRVVDTLVGGDYHSIFKGTGIAFHEVRDYQPGDDVRAIDWNVTARMGHPYIKRFVEERELTVLVVLDVSGSLAFGTHRYSKREVAAELAAVLAFCAISHNDKVGLLAFSDRLDRYLPPGKGTRQAMRVVREVLTLDSQRRPTSLRVGLDALNRLVRRRAIVFLLSDFLDVGFERPLLHAARRHDLIAVRIGDAREAVLPRIGLVELEDAETGRRLLIDTADPTVREAFAREANRRLHTLRQVVRSSGADWLDVTTDGSHLDELVRFFHQRQRHLRQ